MDVDLTKLVKCGVLWSVVALCVLGICLWLYGQFVEAGRLRIRYVSVQDEALGRVLKGKTAVQISDLHIGVSRKLVDKVLEIVGELKPDFIFLTGDYVEWGGDFQPALEFMSRLDAKIGVWAVMGDYDYSNSRRSCSFCHEPNSDRPTTKHSVRFLKDNAEKVQVGDRAIFIQGIDPVGSLPFSEKEGRVALASSPEDDTPIILLSHSPLAFDRLDEERAVLVLAGDTHGGQIPLPSWVWRWLGYEKDARYEKGWFEKGRNRMYVSNGVGTSHFAIRIMRPPEVVVFQFEPQGKE